MYGFERADSFGMADTYRVSNVSPVLQIKWVQECVDGTFYFLHMDGTITRNFFGGEGLYLVSRAPRCGCGSRYEFCENECPWPAEIESDYMAVNQETS
jgi:hypothetical protein